MENTIEISKSSLRYIKKPLDTAVGGIIKSLKTITCTQEDMEYYSTFTYPISPAVFKGEKRDKASWISQQCFYIDFDKDMNLSDALKRLESYSITPNFYYYTFSHTKEKPRFRIVMILDKVITDSSVCQKILNCFGKLFPECDHNCLTLSHMFYGGKECEHITNDRVSLDKLSVIASSFILADNKSKDIGRVIIRKNISSNADELINEKDISKYKRKLRDYDMDWDILYKKCETYRDFVDGRWMYHDELFGVLSNMICFENGDKKFIEIIEKHNETNSETKYSDDKLKLINVIRNYDYLPQHLKNFSKCENDYCYTTFYDVMVRQKKIYDIIDKDYKPVYRKYSEVMEDFNKEMDRIMKEKNCNIYLINLPPGAGKTEWITKQTNLQVAFPTYALLDETKKRLIHEYYATKPKPKFEDLEINEKISYFYSVGFHEKVTSLIGGIARNIGKRNNNKELVFEYSFKDENTAKKYLDSNVKFPDDLKNILTTHRHTIFKQYKETIVFDEDPFSDIFYIGKISKSMVVHKLKKFKDNKEYVDIIDKIKNAEIGKVINKEKINYDKKEMLKDGEFSIPGNIFDFFDSELFTIEDKDYSDSLIYFKHNKLQEDRKYIIFTASPNTMLYKKAYGDRLKILDFSDIENKGKIIQYVDYSCSQSSLKSQNCINFVQKHIGYDPVITFQQYREDFPNKTNDLYFFNLLGYNCYDNKNINVVGTPHLPEYTYMLYGGFLGIDINSEGKMEYRKVAHNNYYFNFMTFKSEKMQKLQFEIIENELKQAIGRPRLLKNNKTVRLFSNFPVKGSIIINEDEEKEDPLLFPN